MGSDPETARRHRSVECLGILRTEGNFPMSTPTPVEPGHDAIVEKDAVESIVPLMPIVLPIVGGVLMLLLASIAVFLA
jgi:hypothetical protein